LAVRLVVFGEADFALLGEEKREVYHFRFVFLFSVLSRSRAFVCARAACARVLTNEISLIFFAETSLYESRNIRAALEVDRY
jgi:hypothetical protein